LIASNTSIGAAVLGLVAEYAKSLLGDSFDVEMMEIHHKKKRDAPSGTALTVLSGLAQSGEAIVFGRPGLRKPEEIGVVSLRGGDVVGEHTVYFLGDAERIEITHRATDRRVFAAGAVRLMERLLTRPPGLCVVRDLLALT
jgi:4-hydroxy-tetrahydrodipicolinate reductase